MDELMRHTDIGAEYYMVAGIAAMVLYIIGRVFGAERKKSAAVAMLLSYLFLVYGTTLLARSPSAHVRPLLDPLWAYKEIAKNDAGSRIMIHEVLLNIIMLSPIGFLFSIIFPKIHWVSIPIGFLVSASIELLQYKTSRGYLEVGDLIHNTVGVMIGHSIYMLMPEEEQREKHEEKIVRHKARCKSSRVYRTHI